MIYNELMIYNDLISILTLECVKKKHFDFILTSVVIVKGTICKFRH